MRWIRDREQRHLPPAASERIQLYFVSLEPRPPPPPGGGYCPPPSRVTASPWMDGLTDERRSGTADGRLTEGWREGKQASGSRRVGGGGSS